MRKNKSVVALVIAAVVLMGLAYVLSRGSAEATGPDAGPAQPEKKKKAAVVFPRDMHPQSGTTAPPAPPAKPPRGLDAMQRALLADGDKGAIFIEANAIRHSPLVEKLLKCRGKEGGVDGLEQMKDQLGIDPSEDVDRLGMDGDVFVATGFFDKLKVPPELGEGAKYGDTGHLWEAKDDKGQKLYFGRVGDGMVMTAMHEDQLKGAMDRAEGRGTAAAPTSLPAGFGEGEVYGTVGAGFLKSLLSQENDPMAQTVLSLVKSSAVRMNVDEDAALSLDLEAVDDKAAQELSKTVSGALAGIRAKAATEGDTELVDLLDQARVSPQGNGRFNLDLAVSGEALLRGMGCGPDGTPLPAQVGAVPPIK